MTPFIAIPFAREVSNAVYGKNTPQRTEIPQGWELDTTFNNLLAGVNPVLGELELANGFFAYALRPLSGNTTVSGNTRILSFRGTEGEASDVLADLADIGETQFGGAATTVNNWIAENLVDGSNIELVGHSLGGALVQRTITNSNRDQVLAIQTLNGQPTLAQFQSQLHFTTFNSPGIILAPSGTDPDNTITVVAGEHHVIKPGFNLVANALAPGGSSPIITGDLVHLLGGAQVGGQVVAHDVNFGRFGKNGNFLEAHFIDQPWWEEPVDPGYIAPLVVDLQRAQAIGRLASNLFTLDPAGEVTSEPEAFIKLAVVLGAGLTVGTAIQLTDQLSQLVTQVGADLQVLVDQLLISGSQGLQSGLNFLVDQANLGGLNPVEFISNVTKVVFDYGQRGSQGDVNSLGFIGNELGISLQDVAKGISNAVSDFISDPTGVLFNLGQTLDFVSLLPFQNAFQAVLDDPALNSLIQSEFQNAKAILEGGGQTVVVQEGGGPNPFNTGGFDPNASPPPTINLEEGHSQTLTVYIPFEAETGGQNISFSLTGGDASTLIINTPDGSLTPQNGEFLITIPEGRQQVTVEVQSQGDLDVDTPFSLSATLVDGAGQATHMPDVEATVMVESAIELTNTRPPGFYDNGFPTRTFNGTPNSDVPTLAGFVNDTVNVFGGNDFVQAFQGNDVVLGGLGNDQLEGGEGRDQVFGEDGQDFLTGDAGDDFLDGGSELDILQAADGNDILLGGGGDDWLLADDRTDFVTRPEGQDFLDGGAGNDLLFAGLGNDHLIGGDGNDELYGDNQGPGPTIGFTTFVGPDPIQPTGRNVFFTADGGEDVLDGGAGNDFLQGDGGDDILLGGAGDDTIFGDDNLAVNAVTPGNDLLDGGSGADSLTGGGGDDQLFGGSEDDLLFGDDVVKKGTVPFPAYEVAY